MGLGTITVQDDNGFRDNIIDDDPDDVAADVPDQAVIASSVTGIPVETFVDSRYYYEVTGSDGSSGRIYSITFDNTTNWGDFIASDFPLDPSVTYTFDSFSRFGDVGYDELVPCFVAGTEIETDRGPVRFEDLRVGDRVRTLGAGFRPINWIGSRVLDTIDLALRPKLRPIVIGASALGDNIPARDLVVSPQHRVLVRSRIARRMFDADEVLLPANKLLALNGVTTAETVEPITYFHFLLDRHHVVFSEGAATENLFVGPEVEKGLPAAALEEIHSLFPHLSSESAPSPLARPLPEKGRRARKLINRHIRNQIPLQ